MISKRAVLCALSLTIAAGPLWAAKGRKPAAQPRGKTEILACRLGTEDRHARIAVVVIGGKTDSFAYYSKWKPRTCSVYLQRNRDMYSKWADTGSITTVSLDKGTFLIEHKPGEYHFIFRDVDRERYCGMDGVINGSLTIKRGSEQCVLDGEIMVEGTPLGEAQPMAARELPPAAAGTSDLEAASAFPGAAPAAPTVPARGAGSASPAVSAPAKPPAETAAKVESQPKPQTEGPAKPETPPKPSETPAKAEASTSAKSEGQSASGQPASKSDAAVPTSKAAPASAGAEAGPKPTESASSSPIRSFFKSLAPRPVDAQSP